MVVDNVPEKAYFLQFCLYDLTGRDVGIRRNVWIRKSVIIPLADQEISPPVPLTLSLLPKFGYLEKLLLIINLA